MTEHIIHRDYCPKCKQHVEPVVPDALPRAMIGHHLISLTSWLHYGLGVNIDQMVEILSYHLQTKLTPEQYQNRCNRLNRRLADLADADYVDAAARRLAKRLQRHAEHIFTFLDYPELAYENNFGER